jgi:hypothetical protein
MMLWTHAVVEQTNTVELLGCGHKVVEEQKTMVERLWKTLNVVVKIWNIKYCD